MGWNPLSVCVFWSEWECIASTGTFNCFIQLTMHTESWVRALAIFHFFVCSSFFDIHIGPVPLWVLKGNRCSLLWRGPCQSKHLQHKVRMLNFTDANSGDRDMKTSLRFHRLGRPTCSLTLAEQPGWIWLSSQTTEEPQWAIQKEQLTPKQTLGCNGGKCSLNRRRTGVWVGQEGHTGWWLVIRWWTAQS